MADAPTNPSQSSMSAGAVVGTTLREHVLFSMHAAPGATGEFTSLINHLSLAIRAHRVLLKGGIFVYPADTKSPTGKLRLLYEANPMAFLFEPAGGMATDGVNRILDIVPRAVHQRVPLAIGSSEDVITYRRFLTQGK